MDDAVLCLALVGVHHLEKLAVWHLERPTVAGLATAQGIEDRAIELDLSPINGDDRGSAVPQIGIVAKQEIGDAGHGRLFLKKSHKPRWDGTANSSPKRHRSRLRFITLSDFEAYLAPGFRLVGVVHTVAVERHRGMGFHLLAGYHYPLEAPQEHLPHVAG